MRLYEMDYQNDMPRAAERSVQRKRLRLFDLSLEGERLGAKTRLARLFFYLLSKGDFEIYYVTDAENGEVIHTSYVTGKSRKFPFMQKGDIHIGPCQTAVSQRGKGLYKCVLRAINSDKQCCCKRAYMIVDELNTPSIRGIEAAGFRHVGSVRKSKLCKVYRRVDDV